MIEKLFETEDTEYKKSIFETKYGNIDYIYLKNNDYLDGLLILNGSIVFREYRGTGKFKEMLRMLLSQFPEGTIMQGAVITKKLTSFFIRIGFKKIARIEYWGAPTNCTLVEGILTKEMINLI